METTGNTNLKSVTDAILIHDLFENQKLKTPDTTAVIFGDKKLTYSQLGQIADELAAAIYAISPDSLVAGVSTFRCIETIISVLAILKAGKAYLPGPFAKNCKRLGD